MGTVTVLLFDISSQIWLYFLSTHRWSLMIPKYSFSPPFVLNFTRTQIFQVLSIPSFDENNINVVGVIGIHQRVDIHICDSRIFVLILPCLQAQAVQYQVPFGENGNHSLLVFVALKTGRNMSTSIKHKYVWKILCQEPLNAFIIHCWCWYHKWCYFLFLCFGVVSQSNEMTQIISIIRNPQRAIKKCWNMAECACAGEDKAASCTVGALSHCRGAAE